MKCPQCDAELKPDYEFCGVCGARLAQQRTPPSAPDPRFQRASDDYFKLRGQLATGRISQERFDAALKDLMIQDAQGRWWSLGVESGKWFVQSGGAWVETVPPGTAAGGVALKAPATLPEVSPPAAPNLPARRRVRSESTPTPPAPPSGGGCGRKLACGCLVVLLVCGVLGAGGFFAYTSGMLKPATLANPQSLTSNQIRDIVQRLNTIDAQIKQYERVSGGSGCTGTIENDQVMLPAELFGFVFPVVLAKNAAVDVTADSAGQLVASCR